MAEITGEKVLERILVESARIQNQVDVIRGQIERLSEEQRRSFKEKLDDCYFSVNGMKGPCEVAAVSIALCIVAELRSRRVDEESRRLAEERSSSLGDGRSEKP